MLKYLSHNKNAVIILHEIYGINPFIQEICTAYSAQDYDVYCPDMIGREAFSYAEASEAYKFFKENVGFDEYATVLHLAQELKLNYQRVLIIGFSVGATIAWRCSQANTCDGIICCYGSRIRDYLSIEPACPTLLLFAQEEQFDVGTIINQLTIKPLVKAYEFLASHGFIDHYSANYNHEQAQVAKEYINEFIKEHSAQSI